MWDQTSLIQRETHPGDPRGKEAVADYRVVEPLADTSLIEVRLHTGKRNQIRIQSRLRVTRSWASSGTCTGRTKCGRSNFRGRRCMRSRLAFAHPADGRELRFEAPLPEVSLICWRDYVARRAGALAPALSVGPAALPTRRLKPARYANAGRGSARCRARCHAVRLQRSRRVAGPEPAVRRRRRARRCRRRSAMCPTSVLSACMLTGFADPAVS